MTIDEFIEEKKRRLNQSLEKFKEEFESRWPNEMPRPFPATFEDWDYKFNS